MPPFFLTLFSNRTCQNLALAEDLPARRIQSHHCNFVADHFESQLCQCLEVIKSSEDTFSLAEAMADVGVYHIPKPH